LITMFGWNVRITCTMSASAVSPQMAFVTSTVFTKPVSGARVKNNPMP